MSELDVHQVMVDSAGWEGRRPELAAVIASIVGQPVGRVQTHLAMRGHPVASVASAEAAEALVQELAAVGVVAFSQLRPVHSDAPKRVGGVAPPAADEGPRRVDAPDTMLPGWRARDPGEELRSAESGTMLGRPGGDEVALGATMISGPARSELRSELEGDVAGSAERTSDPTGARAAVVQSDVAKRIRAERAAGPASTAEASAMGRGSAAARVPPVADAASTSAQVSEPAASPPPPAAPPTAAAPETDWERVLSRPRAEVIPGERRASAPSAEAAPAKAEAPDNERRPQPTPEPAEAKNKRGWSEILGDAMSERLMDAPDRAPSGESAPAGSSASSAPSSRPSPSPSPSRVEPARPSPPPVALRPRSDETLDDVPAAHAEASPNTKLSPSAAALGAGQTPQPSAASPMADKVARQTMHNVADDTQHAFRPPTEVARWSGRPEAPAQFEMLRREGKVAPPRSSSIGMTVAWSIAAPGAGLAYLGFVARGVSYALASPLVVPWFLAGRETLREARRIAAGQAIAPREPSSSSAALYVGAYWGSVALVVALVFGASSMLRPEPAEPPDVAAIEASARARLAAERAAAAEEEERRREAEAARAAALAIEKQAELESLLQQARQNCELEQYTTCRALTEQALEIDDEHPEALRLMVRAVNEGRAEPDPPEEALPEPE